jgi:hypothetical protein
MSDDAASSDPTDMDDIDRGYNGGEEFVDAVNPADRSIDADAADPVADEDGALADLETNGSGNQRIPSVLML